MGKILKRVGFILLCVIIVCVVTFVILFWNELRSLSSIKRLDDYGMFQMTYHGDYGFDDFLLTGADDDSDIEAFVTKHLLKGLPIDLGITGGSCTVFVTRNEAGEMIMGRNFDFSYSPSMQVFTCPANGYASVSTVNLSFCGYNEDNLPSGLNFDSFLSLAAPFLPFDGMNEKGVAIALLAVPQADPPFSEDNVMLNTTTVIRLVLDKTATVDEAVELLNQYNIYFSGGIDCHFLIGDANGNSVLVEYYNGEIQTVTVEKEYQIASNFIAYNGVNIGEGYDEFERYDTVQAAIETNGGVMNEDSALLLLAEVGGRFESEDRLQWSVVYNMSTLKGSIFANRNTGNTTEFQLTS